MSHGFVLSASESMRSATSRLEQPGKPFMNSIIYLIGVIVVVLIVLSFLGLA